MAGEFYRKATTRTRVKKLRIQEKTKTKTNQKMELGRKMGFFNYLLSYEIFISCSSVSLESCGFHWQCSLHAGELSRQGLHVLGPQGPPCLATKLPFLHSHWVGLKDDFLSCTESGEFEPILGLGFFQARLPVARKAKKLGRSWKSRRIRESQSGAVCALGLLLEAASTLARPNLMETS